MVRMAPTITLRSELNPEMDIVIVPYVNGLDTILDMEYHAYEFFVNWFSMETDEPIGDYICNNLKPLGYVRGLNFDMYFGADWEKSDG